MLFPWGHYPSCPEKKLKSRDSQTTTAKILEFATHAGKRNCREKQEERRIPKDHREQIKLSATKKATEVAGRQYPSMGTQVKTVFLVYAFFSISFSVVVKRFTFLFFTEKNKF